MRDLPEWERDNPGELFRRAYAGPPVGRTLTLRQREAIDNLRPYHPVEPDPDYGRRYSVPLDCGHTAVYPSPAPSVRDTIYCRQCADYRLVTGRCREVLGR